MAAKERPRLFSGMQPTGRLHVGNYLGALRQWVELARSEVYDAIFCVVDAHSITVEYDPRELPAAVMETATAYLAAGVDPNQATLFVQSQVPQHMELAWYLSAVTPMGELSRMTQFKEKSEQHKQNVNAGLFTYPVLMAADVMLYKTNIVPVGDDQVQHLELAREITRRFNARFGEVFPEPKPKLSVTPRIMGLDGMHKMSKTRGNTLDLTDSADVLWTKLQPAFTDPQRLRRADPGRPEVCNIFTMHKAFSPAPLVSDVDHNCRTAAWGCIDCKKALHGSMAAELGGLQERMAALRAKPSDVIDVLHEGAKRCRTLADETLREVRAAMGLASGSTR